MIRLFFPALLLSALPLLSVAQGITLSADSGRNEPPLSCSTCAGALWQNTNEIDQSDNSYAETQLQPYLFCFQTLCYRSRYIVCSDFGIDIPNDALVLGIIVIMENKSEFSMMVRDSTLRLSYNGNMLGSNKADTTAWPTSLTVRGYGSPTDKWGVSWTTEELSDTDFGFYYKVYNDGDSSPVFSIDHVQMTIFYQTPQGSFTQTVTPKKFTTYYEPSSSSLSVNFVPGTSGLDHNFQIMNLQGRVIYFEDLLALDEYEKTLSGLNLAPGIYFLWFRTNDEQYFLKFPVSN